MKNILIINGHTSAYSFASPGKLNASLVKKAQDFLLQREYNVTLTTMEEKIIETEEVDKHLWADCIIIQSPVFWMGFPGVFKKYIDDVLGAGYEKLYQDDGRSSSDPKNNYGTGGLLKNKKYMLSLTFNAPKEAFNDPKQTFFNGKSVDDVFLPEHLIYQFLGLSPLKTFVCYDVIKNPEIENDFIRYENHLKSIFD